MADAYKGRGIAYYHLERFEQAKKDLDKCLKEKPNDFEAKKYLNLVNEELDALNAQKALAEAERQRAEENRQAQYQNRRIQINVYHRTRVYCGAYRSVIVYRCWGTYY